MIFPRARSSFPALRVWWVTVTAALAMSGGNRSAEGAAAPADLPAPFVQGDAPGLDHEAAWSETLAERALQAGMYHLAENLYQRALARADLPASTRRTLELGRVSALIAQGKRDDAVAALESMAGPRDSAWELRRSLVDYLAGDLAAVATRLESVRLDEMPETDEAWKHFLRAAVADAEGDRGKADAAFEEALQTSPSASASAWFRLEQFQSRLNVGEATEELLAQINRTREDPRWEGRDIAFEATLQYASILERLGRRDDAVQVLQRQRRQLPAGNPELREKTLLLLGLIAGVNTNEGYTALHDLLEQGSNVSWQRIALQHLVAATESPATGRAGEDLTLLLDALLGRDPPHPLTEDLLFYRAALALRKQDFESAEADAARLRQRFPGSTLRPGALALLASSSWQRTRYRSAADYVTQLREAMPAGAERARLAVLIGECYFRAGSDAQTAEDFRNAADAYQQAYDEIAALAKEVGTLEAERLAGVSMGTLFFQRVQSLIKSGNMDGAAAALAGAEAANVDAESRWRAAWNYVRFLQLAGRADEAFRQLETWGAVDNAPPDLRLKFLWLLAQLTVESQRWSETAARVTALRDFLRGPSGAGVDPQDRVQVESNAVLLEAQAQLEQDETEAGNRALDQLRRDFPDSDAAIFSYIVQARYLAESGQLVEAQRLLKYLADEHPKSAYAPRALFEAAELAKKRGADAYLIEARDLLEQLATRFPRDNYAFFARLEQGDILRRLNQFASAEQVYLQLENNYPTHPYRNIAQLSLADTLMAQKDNDPAKFDAAISRLERLTDLPSAEPDLRVEAGFKLGYGWQNHGQTERAIEYYWDVYQRFLGELRPGQNRIALGSRGHYWLARALLELAEIALKAGRRDEARRSFQAVVDHGLPGRDLAQGRLTQLQAGP